jgi:hypothetical protein
MVGRSARRDWSGFTHFTSTPPGPSRCSGPERSSMASVPSIASTARTSPCCTTHPCPTSATPRARQTAMPRRMSARARSSGSRPARSAAGGSRSARTLLGADHLEPILGQHLHDGAQDGIIPGEGCTADPSQQLQARCIRPQRQDRGARYGASEHHLPHAVFLQPGQHRRGEAPIGRRGKERRRTSRHRHGRPEQPRRRGGRRRRRPRRRAAGACRRRR